MYIILYAQTHRYYTRYIIIYAVDDLYDLRVFFFLLFIRYYYYYYYYLMNAILNRERNQQGETAPGDAFSVAGRGRGGGRG